MWVPVPTRAWQLIATFILDSGSWHFPLSPPGPWLHPQGTNWHSGIPMPIKSSTFLKIGTAQLLVPFLPFLPSFSTSQCWDFHSHCSRSRCLPPPLFYLLMARLYHKLFFIINYKIFRRNEINNYILPISIICLIIHIVFKANMSRFLMLNLKVEENTGQSTLTGGARRDTGLFGC